MSTFEMEMKRLYDFGPGDGSGEQTAADGQRTGATPSAQPGVTPPAALNTTQMNSLVGNDDDVFSPDTGDSYMYSPRTVFGNASPSNHDDDTFDPNAAHEVNHYETGNGELSRHVDVNNMTARPAKPKRGKTHAIKEVLGINHTSTKGKTEEEKAQLELDRRWRNALAEEERLTELERQITTRETITASITPEPNFPPQFLCIKPLIYHNIKMVPEHRQRFVKIAFCNWIAVCFLLIVNAITAIAVIEFPTKRDAGSAKKVNKMMSDVLALVSLFGIPLSFLFWYWRIYKACSTGSPGEHTVALCGLLIALAHALFAFSGPLNYGVCGIGLALWLKQVKSSIVAVVVAVITLLWLLEAIIIAYLLVNMFIYYRRDLRARREARRMMPSVIG